MRQLFCAAAVLMALSLKATAQFTMQGEIEYERKINMHRAVEDEEWFEQIKSQVPKFDVSYFDLLFNASRSLYRPGREVPNKPARMFGGSAANENVVASDFTNNQVRASKQIYEQTFLVQDSIRKIDWKITDEVRIIADYKCRKAVGRICDSVVVVAFYTDDIPLSGGPEMFAGLPGMILEVAVPRLFATWTATKIEQTAPAEKDLQAPAKGKKTSQKELFTTLQSSLKDWGKYAQRNIWWSLL